MAKIPEAGIYVTVVRVKTKEVHEGLVKFKGNRLFLALHEILSFFGITTKLCSDEKIWIKREYEIKFIHDACKLSRQFNWIEFNNCFIAISPRRPLDIKELLDFKNSLKEISEPKFPWFDLVVEADKAYERDLAEQVKIWQARREKKTLRGISKVVQLRQEATQVIIRKKRKARIAKKQEEAHKKEQTKETPES